MLCRAKITVSAARECQEQDDDLPAASAFARSRKEELCEVEQHSTICATLHHLYCFLLRRSIRYMWLLSSSLQ